MPRSRHAWSQIITCWTATLALAATVNAGGPRLPWKSKTSVEHLAEKIDCLEKHIETYGTIVPKTPDVWGEARLTKYRVEFEEEMKGQKGKFNDTINAAISRTDQAFLTSTLALQAAISGRSASVTVPSTRSVTSAENFYVINKDGQQVLNAEQKPVIASTRNTSTPLSGTQEERLNPPTPISDPLSSAVSFQKVDILREQEGHGFTVKGVALEPTISLDQRARYLNHLHQLRRNNDGDDRSDSPGYGLHLVRIPVSVLPGRKTEAGYGAEITVTAKPYIHDKLLESTFRELVINDLVDQLSFPLTKFLDAIEGRKVLAEWKTTRGISTKLACETRELHRLFELLESTLKVKVVPSENENGSESPANNFSEFVRNYIADRNSANTDVIPKGLKLKDGEEGINTFADLAKSKQLDQANRYKEDYWQIIKRIEVITGGNFSNDPSPEIVKQETLAYVEEQQKSLRVKTDNLISQATATIPAGNSRRSTLPFPPTRLVDVYGAEPLAFLAERALSLRSDPSNTPHLLLLDVQKFLAEELRAGYAILEAHPELWQYCDVSLAQQIRVLNVASLTQTRDSFICSFDDNVKLSHIPVLVWATIVESALLNERLIEDMKQMQAAKNCVCINTDWLPYYMPNPEPHVVESFRQYVECRWPIQVFAVDPITSDQNVADSVSIRREMQLALSVALASGRINVQKFLRFARSLAIDMETISLNQTVVGFAHGGDTFGWRFYPRVQAPPSRGNFVVATRELLIGGYTHDQMLRTRRLEPGIRECTAIVLMPQFVPYAIFDTRTNWFKLDNPAKREFDLEESMVVSRNITTMQQLSQACVTDQHLYRPEEVRHLQTAVNQLEKRLPLQTSWVQLPFENPLGGFEFFNGGTPDLSPELHGFYGEPGLRPDGTVPTSIFVVGNNFSVHETRVIVGNRALDENEFQLLSRQVIQVTAKVPFEIVGDQVDIHVATPYGVSNHLLVPVLPTKAQVEATAAAKAISDHEAARHLDRFDWKKAPNFRIGVTTKAGAFQTFDYIPSSVSPFAELTLARQDLSDKNVNSSLSELDKQLSPTPVVGKLIFQISVSVDGQPQPVGQFAIGPVSLALGQKLDATAVNELDKQLRTKLSSAIPPRVETAKLTFTGFVRLPALYNTETVQLEKPFEARLDLFEK